MPMEPGRPIARSQERRPVWVRRAGLLAVGLGLLAAVSVAWERPARLQAQTAPSPAEAPPSADATDRAGEVRALWVQRGTLTSPESIAEMVRRAGDSGFNTLVVQVRGRGDAFFLDSPEPRAAALLGQAGDFDPLATVLALARPAGLRVHAWMNVNLVASPGALSTDPRHVVLAHPEWLMVPRELAGTLAQLSPQSPAYLGHLVRYARERADRIEGVYLSPIPEQALQYTVSIVSDLVRRYDVDGVHFDYMRYPNDAFDYSRESLARFRREIAPELEESVRVGLDRQLGDDPTAYADRFPDRWSLFRQERLTALVLLLRNTVKALRPEAIVSAAVFPDADDARDHRLQDWGTWTGTGLLDVVCPMAYTTDGSLFLDQVAAALRSAGPADVWAGIGAYRLSPAETVDRIRRARSLGTHGVVLFSYDNFPLPTSPPAELADIGREAFGL